MARTCIDCGCPISRLSKGRCRACGAASLLFDPEIEAKRLARLREKLSSPAHAEKMSGVRKSHEAERMKDPAYREKRRQHGLQVRQRFLATPGAEDRRRAAQAAAMRKRAENMFAWCPADRRDEYERLRKAFGAPEARRIILEDEIAKAKQAAARPAKAPLTLEEQLARVAAGATLVPAFKPRKSDPEFTLGGIATGMI